jgi:DNA-binding NarL/FixJ family response regulator
VSGSRAHGRGEGLSEDDLRLLGLLASGRAPEAIARELEISERTLRRRLRHVCDLLGVRTPIEAVVWAVRSALI